MVLTKIKNFLIKQYNDIKKGNLDLLFRKVVLFIRYFIKYTRIFFLGLVVPLIFVLKKIFNFHFFELQSDRIGYYCSWEPFIWITHYKRIEKNRKKLICLIYFQKVTANKYLTKLYVNKMRSLEHYYFLKGHYFWEIITQSYKVWTGKKIKTFFATKVLMYSMFSKTPSLLKIPEDDQNRGLKLLDKLNIPRDSRWICIHNRDSGYLENQSKFGYMSDVNWRYHNHRDFHINDLLQAANYFSKKGYYVIRTGNFSKHKLNINDPKIIDYVNSQYRSDFGEIYFFANCEFYFGSSAGCWKIAEFFRKPSFLINSFPFTDIFTTPRKYPGIFKKIKFNESNQIMPISEIIKNNLNHASYESIIKKGLDLANNNPGEILDLAIEALDIVENKKKPNINYQTKINQMLNEVFKDKNNHPRYYRNPIGEKFLENLKI